MTPRARAVRARLFTAGLYALTGDAPHLFEQVMLAVQLLEPNPWYGGGLGGGWS